MKSPIHRLLLCAGLLLSLPVVAQSHQHQTPSDKSQPATGELLPVTEKDAAWAKQARQEYPLTHCVVSEEALGSMGEPDQYIYRVKGQPDRLVMFCCGGCEEDFMADPAAHLAKIDAAKKSGGKPSDKAKESNRTPHAH